MGIGERGVEPKENSECMRRPVCGREFANFMGVHFLVADVNGPGLKSVSVSEQPHDYYLRIGRPSLSQKTGDHAEARSGAPWDEIRFQRTVQLGTTIRVSTHQGGARQVRGKINNSLPRRRPVQC